MKMSEITLYNDDCFNIMNQMVNDKIKVDCIITDIPYQISVDNNSDNHTLFLLKVSDGFGLDDSFRDRVINKMPITLEFNDIQCKFYEMVDKLISLIHRYL